jgi:hypothetical protein
MEKCQEEQDILISLILQSLSACDWVNAVAQSTLAGEVTVNFSHQLLIGVDAERGVRDKRMVCMISGNMRSQFTVSVTLELRDENWFYCRARFVKINSSF